MIKFNDSPGTWQIVANHAKKLKNPGKYFRGIAEKLNVDVKTVYRKANEFGWVSERKVRKDAFILTAEMEGHVRKISAIYHMKIEKDSKYPLRYAVMSYLDTFPEKDRPQLPSISTIHRYFRRLGLDRKSVKTPTPHIRMKTDYPNHCHQVDFSLTWTILDEKIIPMFLRDNYKNKPSNLNNPNRLVLMAVTDHFSGCIYPMYFKKQQVIDIASFLYNAWAPKDDARFPFQGVPDILMMDNDKALWSYAMQMLFELLGVKTPHIMPHKSRAKGSVEKGIDVWQRFFEARLLNIKERVTLEDINKAAFEQAIIFNSKEIHSRHGMTRFACWHKYIEDHCRIIPSWEIYQDLLRKKPVPRWVDGAGVFSLDNIEYQVKGIYSKWVDVYIHPFRYERDKAVTIQYPSKIKATGDIRKDQIQTITVLPAVKTHGGYFVTDTTIGTYAAVKETDTQKNLKIQEKIEVNHNALSPVGKVAKDSQIFLPVAGRDIRIIPDIIVQPLEFTRIQALSKISEMLHRALTQDERITVNSLFKEKEKMNEKEIEEIVLEFKSPLKLQQAGGMK